MGAPAKRRTGETANRHHAATLDKNHVAKGSEALDDACDKIIAQILKMIDQSEKWIIKAAPKHRRPRH